MSLDPNQDDWSSNPLSPGGSGVLAPPKPPVPSQQPVAPTEAQKTVVGSMMAPNQSASPRPPQAPQTQYPPQSPAPSPQPTQAGIRQSKWITPEEHTYYTNLELENGLPPGYIGGTARVESEGDGDWNSKAGSNVGRFQFNQGDIDTWLGPGHSVQSKGDQVQALVAEANHYKKQIEAITGKPATAAELYLAHQQREGFINMLKNPNALASQAVGNLEAITGNGGQEGQTGAQFIAMWNNKFNRAHGEEDPAAPGTQYAQNNQVMNDASPSTPPSPDQATTQEIEIPTALRKTLGLPIEVNPPKEIEIPEALKAKLFPQASPSSKVVGVTEFGAPIYDDENANREVRQGEMDVTKGLLAGAATNVTGLGELVPGISRSAAEASKYLESVGQPFANKVGQIGPMLIPGASVIADAAKIPEGASLLTRLLSPARAGAYGATTGAISGLLAPSGTTGDYTQIIEQKLRNAGSDALWGGAIGTGGTALGLIFTEGGKLTGLIRDAIGKEATQAAEELRTGVSQKTGKALSNSEKELRLATVDKALEKARVERHERVLSDTRKASEEANKAKDTVISDLQKRNVVTAEAMGDEAQAIAKSEYDRLKGIRSKESGFDAAVKADKGEPSINTESALKALNDIDRKYANSGLQPLKDALVTKPVVRKGPTTNGVSIERGRDFSAQINAKIDAAEAEGRTGLANNLKQLRQSFIQNMETTHEPLRTANAKYRELSRPLDIFERTGALKKSVGTDAYSGELTLDPAKMASAITKGGVDGPDAMSRLIQAKPEFKNTVRDYYNGVLFGPEGAKRGMTADKVDTFLRNNETGLKKTGLYDEFTKVRDDLKNAETRSTALEKDVAELSSSKGPLNQAQSNVTDLARQQTVALKARNELSTLQINLKEARSNSDIIKASTSSLNSLRKDRIVSDAEYSRLLNEIKDVTEKEANHQDAAKKIRQIITAAAIYGAATAGLSGAGSYFSHRITP